MFNSKYHVYPPIHNLDEAVEYYKERLAPKAKIIDSFATVKPPFSYSMDNNDVVMLKRKWCWAFHKFYNIPGWGQTYNLEMVKEVGSQRKPHRLVFTNVEGTIYGTDAKAALDFVMDHRTWRVPNTSIDGQLECSIPIRMCKCIYKEQSDEIEDDGDNL